MLPSAITDTAAVGAAFAAQPLSLLHADIKQLLFPQLINVGVAITGCMRLAVVVLAFGGTHDVAIGVQVKNNIHVYNAISVFDWNI